MVYLVGSEQDRVSESRSALDLSVELFAISRALRVDLNDAVEIYAINWDCSEEQDPALSELKLVHDMALVLHPS